MAWTEAERKNGQERIKNLLKGKREKTIYTTVVHVSRSGMFRLIRAHIISKGKPVDISVWAAQALGWGFDRDRWGVKVSGCGMDMTFHLVYELSSVLYGYKNRGGYKIKNENM